MERLHADTWSALGSLSQIIVQFEVHRHEGGLVIDCRSDLLSDLATRMVVPLFVQSAVPPPLKRLHTEFEISGHRYIMATHLLGAVDKRALGPAIISLANHNIEIISAIDMLLNGY